MADVDTYGFDRRDQFVEVAKYMPVDFGIPRVICDLVVHQLRKCRSKKLFLVR